MRTTSTLEAYNCVLGDNVTNRGQFFKFAHDLRAEELLKSRELEQLFESGGATQKQRKIEWMVCIFHHFLYFSPVFVFFMVLLNF